MDDATRRDPSTDDVRPADGTPDAPAAVADEGDAAATPSRRPWWRRAAWPVARWVGLVAVALGGAAVGWSLSPATTTWVGPLEVRFDVVPSLDPGVQVQLPPVGQVHFDTHEAPVAVAASVLSVDVAQAQALIGSPQGLLALQLSAPDVVADAARQAVLRDVAFAVGGALAAGGVVYRSSRRAVQTTGVAALVLALVGAGTAVTFDPSALRGPRYTGLLSTAPYIAGEGAEVAQRLESYRSGLADFIRSVTTVYAVSDQLPVLDRDDQLTTVLHVSDLHLNPLGFDLVEQLVEQFRVDVVADTGDVTTWGTDLESSFLEQFGGLGVPYLFVRGNHDSRATEAAVAAQGAIVLDGDVTEVAGLTFAGIGDPVFTPSGEVGEEADQDLIAESTQDLADVVTSFGPSSGTTGRGVDVALLHDPSRLDPLLGEVPLVLAGHYHRRATRVDESGTRVMVQGTTGGAGLTIAGLERLGEGNPLPLSATLLHFATTGERAGRVVAFDEVTVGGLGLASVTVERTTVPEEEVASPQPLETSGPPEGGGTPGDGTPDAPSVTEPGATRDPTEDARQSGP